MLPGQMNRQPGTLPVESSGFVGREAELSRIMALLERARLVTVVGTGGVGKTRVALRAAARAAARYADGVCLVELSTLRDPELLPHTVAGCLGLPEHDARPRLDAVLGYLRDRDMLLILDTCEHLIDACATLAERVLLQTPGVTVLATSREPLDVIGENTCPIPPLHVPAEDAPESAGDAVALFAQRAAAAVPGFTVTAGNRAEVIRLCRRLDGIPLAIELAAVRLRALPIAELASRLDSRPALLTGEQRGRAGRHKTLRDAIGWSYDLCTPAEQALWARLSVFAGSFGIDAAEEVCAGGELDRSEIIETMVRLVDKSVLIQVHPRDDMPGYGRATRYRMLDTIREFGAGQLAASGTEAVRDRYVARYLSMARYFREHLLEDDQLERFRELREEHANIRAALEYTLDAGTGEGGLPGAELATTLCCYWEVSGLLREGIYWLGKVIDRRPDACPERARALILRGYLAAMQGKAILAVGDTTEGIRLGELLGEQLIVARGYLYQNTALICFGRFPEAAQAAVEAKQRLGSLGDRLGLIVLDIQLAYLAEYTGNPDEALSHAERGLRRLGTGSERWLRGYLHITSALALFQTGRDAECDRAVREALRVKHELGDILGTAFALEIHGWLLARIRRHQRAAWLLGAADPLWARAGGRLSAIALMERLHQQAVDQCRETLGDDQFAALFARAARYPLGPLVTFALGDGDEPAGEGAKARQPGKLTAREQEISTLVAGGLSNRKIAEQLVISRRTVDAHVEHIFAKLGISSRVELANAVLRDRLDQA